MDKERVDRVVELVKEFRGRGRVIVVIRESPRQLKALKKQIEIRLGNDIVEDRFFYRTKLADGTIIRYRDKAYSFDTGGHIDAAIVEKGVIAAELLEFIENIDEVRSF
jgi:hypothetical protein